jgi:putative RNA 2'-phosphotransferase
VTDADADAVGRCPAHGFVAGDTCPVCGTPAARVLPGERRRRLSTFLSGLLRHFPGDFGLGLDAGGWADLDAVVAAATEKCRWADREAVLAVIAADPKGRFERRPDEVRAAYGHSVDVTLGDTEDPVPDALYHGTARENLADIRAEGLRSMARREVHLSPDRETARRVGRRHVEGEEPAVLVVDAGAMERDGRRLTRRGPETVTADTVPPEYLSGLDGGDP